MMRRRRRACAAVLVAIGLMGSGLHTAAAGETIRDEAGRVIYTIDDGGIVSMFENSPTDLTISVTRGTREEMKPQVSEVVPESVPAGASTVLKLKGKNLVGASVKLSATPGRSAVTKADAGFGARSLAPNVFAYHSRICMFCWLKKWMW